MRTFLLGVMAFALVGALVVTQAVGDEEKKKAAVGEPAPEFSLEDQTGKTHSLADYKGKVVVLEWFNEDCPYVVKHYRQGHMNKLADKYKEQDVVWLAINSTSGKTIDSNKAIAAKWNIDRPILLDSGGKVGQLYGATNTPHMYVIDKDGKLVYMGAIDDNDDSRTDSIASAKNYVAAALDAVLAGQPVEMSRTKAYGCVIKYPRN